MPRVNKLILVCLLGMLVLACTASGMQQIGGYNSGQEILWNPESNGGMPVNIQDQITPVVDLYLHTHIEGVYSISTSSTLDTRSIVMNSTVTPVTGNLLCLKESGRYYQGRILSFTGSNPYTLTVDAPLDYAFSTAAEISLTEHDLAVDGSSARVIYHIRPPDGVKWDIVRLIFYIEDNLSMDDAEFGAGVALTNGVVLRVVDGIYSNVFIVKTNGEFGERSYDKMYSVGAVAGPGVYSLTIRRTFGGQDKNGVVLRLDGSTLDDLEVIVQDDLSGLLNFHVIAQGHVVQD